MLILINTTLKPNTYVLFKDGEYFLEVSKSNDISIIEKYYKSLGANVETI